MKTLLVSYQLSIHVTITNVDFTFSLDFQSSSPPRKDPATVYTPSSAQKRFNPFMKDTMGKNDDDSSEPTRHKSNTSPQHKKPLTPTKDHPLADLERKSPKGEFMDDSDDDDDDVVEDTQPDDAVGSDDGTNINEINEIPPELDNYQATTVTTAPSNRDDLTNNNSNRPECDDEGKLAPETVVKRRVSPSRTNNNNANAKNNNRVGRDRSQPRIEDGLTKSTDKLDGEFGGLKFDRL